MCYQKFIQKVGIDKVAHFALSAFLCLALGRLFPVIFAAFLVAALGVMKETLDEAFDWKDLLADALGVLAATLTMMI